MARCLPLWACIGAEIHLEARKRAGKCQNGAIVTNVTVHKTKLKCFYKTNLLVEVDGPVAKRDAVTEAVLACGAAKLPIQPDVLALGVGVEAGGVHVDVDRRGRGPSLRAGPVVGQGVALSADRWSWLQGCICRCKKI